MLALREIAERSVSPEDVREGLIHSIQKNVEVDEPEAGAAPLLTQDRRPTLGRDDQSSDMIVDQMTMTEEQLAAMEKPDAVGAVKHRQAAVAVAVVVVAAADWRGLWRIGLVLV
ncbi:MAG: hypothetical protein R3D67_11520 [Hyphomicrobiaceae bacterium]